MTPRDLVPARRVYIALVLTGPAVTALACGGGASGPNQCAAEAISHGQLAVAGEYGFVVRIETGPNGCTGTAIAPRAIVLAAHCAPPGPGAAILRTGPSAEICVGPDGACGAVGIDVTTHPDLDLAIVRLTDFDLVEPAGGFARIDAARDFARFEAVGYGVGSYSGSRSLCASLFGERLIHAGFDVDWEDPAYFGGFVQPGRPAVCSGDSGGPAIQADGGVSYVVGVLSGSDSAAGADCAPDGGFELWLKTGPLADWINQWVPAP